VGSLGGPATYDPATNRFSWDGSLEPGDAVVIEYELDCAASLGEGSQITNRAVVADGSGLRVERDAVTWIDSADLSASGKTASGARSLPGEVLTYSLVLRNSGQRTAQASLTDPLPLHTHYVLGGASASSGVLSATEEAITWSGAIASGEGVTISFPVHVSSPIGGPFLVNRAALDDGWGRRSTLEVYTRVEARFYLPLMFRGTD
jgi:uncharacterized repeat protein (TIGR01451 family)